jgi:hypothetical protein
LIFFGVYCFLLDWLVVRSIFLQQIIGVMMMVGGWVYAMLLHPPFLKPLQSYNLVPGGLGEFSLMLWLLVIGADSSGWNAQGASKIVLNDLQR